MTYNRKNIIRSRAGLIATVSLSQYREPVIDNCYLDNYQTKLPIWLKLSSHHLYSCSHYYTPNSKEKPTKTLNFTPIRTIASDRAHKPPIQPNTSLSMDTKTDNSITDTRAKVDDRSKGDRGTSCGKITDLLDTNFPMLGHRAALVKRTNVLQGLDAGRRVADVTTDFARNGFLYPTIPTLLRAFQGVHIEIVNVCLLRQIDR